MDAVIGGDGSAQPGPLDEAGPPIPLVIAVTPSPAERIRLAERLDGIAPLLLVSDLDELRRLIAVRPAARGSATGQPAPDPGPDDMLRIDSVRSVARCGEREVFLTRLEHDLLTRLTSEPARVWSYAELHRTVWHDEGRQRTADVQSLVKRLRRKLDQLGTGVTLVAVRGVGFRLTDQWRPRVDGA
ncbi:two-component system response regulator [Micromonospora sp. ATCC 39149]|nr:two-component system response regulator [Micromonospora sp. ATCC 39149]